MVRSRFALLALASLLLAPPLAPPVLGATAFLDEDDDAGSGGDAGDDAASALRVVPGVLRGRVREAVDPADWYAFPVRAGQGVHVHIVNAPGAFSYGGIAEVRVYDPSGAPATRSGYEHEFVAARSGEHRVSVVVPCVVTNACADPLRPSANRTYDLILVVEDLRAQDDGRSGGDAGGTAAEAIVLPDGLSEGWMGRYDHADWYAVPVTRGESIDIQVWTVPGSQMGHVFGDASWRPYGYSSGYQVYPGPWQAGVSWTSDRDGVAYFYASDGGDSGSYWLRLTRAAAEDYRAATPIPGEPPMPGIASGFGDGVGVVSPAGVWRANASGAWQRAAFHAYGAAHDADGRLYFTDVEARVVKRLAPDGAVDVVGAAPPGEVAFGPDGHLYVLEVDADWQHVVRFSPDGTRTAMGRFREDTGWNALASFTFGPDGAPYALWRERAVVRLDLANGTFAPEMETACCLSGLAFDAAGRAYASNRLSKSVYRLDLANDTFDLVGLAYEDARLAFAEDALYATGVRSLEARAGRLELGVEGFAGFQPAWP